MICLIPSASDEALRQGCVPSGNGDCTLGTSVNIRSTNAGSPVSHLIRPDCEVIDIYRSRVRILA